MEEYARLVNKAKTETESMQQLITLMQPLIKSFRKKLFFLDNADAEQEITLSIIEAVHKIKHCEKDGQCISFINNAVKFRFIHLCKRNMKKEGCELCDEFIMDKQIYSEKFGDIDFKCDIKAKIESLSINQRKIYYYLQLEYSDKEIAKELKVSRQYINRIKKKIIKEIFID